MPVFLDLTHRRVLLVGGGAEALEQLTAVLDAQPTAAVTVVAPQLLPALRTLAARVEAGTDVTEAAQTLLDLARVQDGDMPADPAAFARRVTAALAAA